MIFNPKQLMYYLDEKIAKSKEKSALGIIKEEIRQACRERISKKEKRQIVI